MRALADARSLGTPSDPPISPGGSDEPKSTPKSFNYPVQGFRGFAAGCVFVFHMFASNVLPPMNGLLSWSSVLVASSSLRYGVELFFMISGYVILGSLLRHKSLRAFFWDRVLRIYPAFVPVHLVVFALGPIVGWGFFHHIDATGFALNFVANILFLPTVFPVPLAHWAAWSLSYEWVFYFIAAASMLLLRPKRHHTLVLCSIFAFVIVALNFYPRGLFFIPGVIANLNESWIRKHRRLFRFPTVALIVFLAAWRFTDVDASEPISQLIYWLADARIVMLIVAFLAGLYLISAVILGEGLFGALLKSGPCRFLGTISYSFYLWHPIVVVAVKRLVLSLLVPRLGAGAGAVIFVLASLIISLVLSWGAWWLFENQLSRWLKRRVEPMGAIAAPRLTKAQLD